MNAANILLGVAQFLNSGMRIAIGTLMLVVAEWLRGSHGAMPGTEDFSLLFILISMLALIAFVDVLRRWCFSA